MTWLMCRLIKISNDASQQITTLLYIKRACELNKSHIFSTDEDPGLRIESFAVINLRGVSTNKTICFIAMQTYKELIIKKCLLFRCRHAVVIMQTLNWTNQCPLFMTVRHTFEISEDDHPSLVTDARDN